MIVRIPGIGTGRSSQGCMQDGIGRAPSASAIMIVVGRAVVAVGRGFEWGEWVEVGGEVRVLRAARTGIVVGCHHLKPVCAVLAW